MSDNPKLRYKLPSEASARNFARYAFDEIAPDMDVRTRHEHIAGFSEFLVTVAEVLAKTESCD